MRAVSLVRMLLGSLLAWAALSGAARAAAPPAPLTAEQRKELEAKAKALFQEGEQAYQQNRLGEAVKAFTECLAIYRRLHKGDHPDVARSLNNLGFLLQHQGKAAEAEPYWRAALAMRQRLFKGDHPDVALSLNNLGALLQAQGKAAEAEPYYRAGLAMSQRLFKGDHP